MNGMISVGWGSLPAIVVVHRARDDLRTRLVSKVDSIAVRLGAKTRHRSGDSSSLHTSNNTSRTSRQSLTEARDLRSPSFLPSQVVREYQIFRECSIRAM